jgi:hypothetical protein
MTKKIELRSLQTILGNMIARMTAEGDFDDLSPGSAFMTTIEAAAVSDFITESKLIRILNMRNIDESSGIDLENMAEEMGVFPRRLGATSSVVLLTIKDSNFNKIATNIYAGTISPTAGDTVIRVVEGEDLPSSGKLYLGRGTRTSEVVNYTSIQDNGSYWTITLQAPLEKDHLVGEEVILSQGGDRYIPAGTTAIVEGVSGVQSVEFSTQVDHLLQDGEDTISGIIANSLQTGSQSIVGRKKITSFLSTPFSGATVTNEEPSSGGRDEETDAELRQRIKDHPHTLSRGTETAIRRAVIGVKDDEENKRVISAYLRKPTSGKDQVVLYIDDGMGFSPSFSGVSEEVMVIKATGKEQFFQLQKWPVVKTQIATIAREPFALDGSESLYVEVDGQFEERILAAQYRTPNVVSAQEVAEVINRSFSSIEARAKDGLLFISPVADDPDYIRVGAGSSLYSSDANKELRFPTTKQYTIRVYRNDKLMEKNGKDAVIQTLPYNQWNNLTSTETLQLKVDGINSSIITLTDDDFLENTMSNTLEGASLIDWVTILNKSFIGITASFKDDGTIALKSNKGKNDDSKIEVVGGTLASKIFSANAHSQGTSPEYKLNKLLGQIELVDALEEGEELKVGTTHTRGFVLTSDAASYNLPATNGLPSEICLVGDAQIEHVAILPTGVLSFSEESSIVTSIEGQTNQFKNVRVNDYCYLYNAPRSGVLRVIAASHNKVYLSDPTPASGSLNLEDSTCKVKFFRTEGLPQIVKFPIGSNVLSTQIINAFNSQLLGIVAEEIETGEIRIYTTRFDGNGGLGIVATAGSAYSLNIPEQNYKSNDPHFASIESGDLTCTPSQKLSISQDDLEAPYSNLKISGTFSKDNGNKPIFKYLGSNSKLIRQPHERLSSNTLKLRNTLPSQINPTGKDSRAVSVSGIEVGQGDNMVFLIDNDPAKKTFDIPMFIEGSISGPSVPSNYQFDLIDLSGAKLAADRWLGHRFEDYRIWFQARAILPTLGNNSDLKITSVNFGPNGERIKIGVVYPRKSSSPLAASYSISPLTNEIIINIQLASGDTKSFGLLPSRKVKIVGREGHIRAQFRSPVNLLNVQLGDILSINGSEFDDSNSGQFRIHTINNMVDNSHAFGHYEHTTIVTVSNKRNITLNQASPKTLKVGDRFAIDGIIKTVDQVTNQTQFRVEVDGFDYPLRFITTNTYDGSGNYVSSTTEPYLGNDPDGFTYDGFGNVVTQIQTDTSPITGTVIHQDLSADSPLSFTPEEGEIIDIGGVDYIIEEVISPVDFKIAQSQQYSFYGVRSGTISRLFVEAHKFSSTVDQEVVTTSSSSVEIFSLPESENAADEVANTINGTAGILDLIKASHVATSDGSGSILESTQEVLEGSGTHVSLLNGEGYIHSSQESSPSFRLKDSVASAPEIGEKVRLIPMTPNNIADHFSRKQISGLSIAADVHLVDAGRRVQISSKNAGGEGQVFAVGGRASGLNTFRVRGNAQELSNSIGAIELDRSAIELMSTGHLIKISQPFSAKKRIPSLPSNAKINIQVPALGYAQVKFDQTITSIIPYSQSEAIWAVRNIGRNRVRYEAYSGIAQITANLKADDWVLIGNGENYAGIQTDKKFSPANQGWHQIRETDGFTYFDIDGRGVEEFVATTVNSIVFCSYHSPRVGDKLVLGKDLPIASQNKGTFEITQVIDGQTLIIKNATSLTQDWVNLGSSSIEDVAILDQGYSTYRKITMFAPKTDNPTERSIVVVSPGYDLSLLSEGQNATITFPNRLGFGTDPVPGVSGYNYWTGLKRKVQRVVDGYLAEEAEFPGYGAAGVSIEVREPRIQRVKISMKVKTARGVSLQSLSDAIKSVVSGYINSLGLGQDVVMSEVIKLVQQIPGVDALVLSHPNPSTERISVGDKSIARIFAEDIILS